MDTTANNDFFKQNVLGHPAGLFILFFTEMWERFSYYGMRAILVLFLTSSLADGGWAWPRANALALYGTYTAMVYLTPIVGGFVADKYLGHRKSVLLGAFIMTLGHASMALESATFLYIGLLCLIMGNGFFKPNMTSIVSQMYKDHPEKKDGAYTIFYMGVNSGAFIGMMLCGYMGEKVGWSWGFGLAGIFMFFGMIMFYLAQPIFGSIGMKPINTGNVNALTDDGDKRNPFTTVDKILISITATLALVWVINDPMSKIYNSNIFGNSTNAGYVILFALLIFLFILFSRILRYSPVTRDRMFAVVIIAFFYMLFWASFEQAGGSMTIFAKDYMDRSLTGDFGFIFKVFNTLLTVVPLGIITWVLFKLFKVTYKDYTPANLVLSFSFLIVWGIVIWMLYREFSLTNSEVQASWFQILNSFFIISLAPLFSKVWESKYNPPGAFKYAIGLIFLGLGFASLAYGTTGIPLGAKAASVSMLWLVLAYLFHTMGELCISPVGLSYVSKLVPGRMIAIMFGIWYLAVAIGNKLAGTLGGRIDEIVTEHGMTYFFLIFTIVPFGAAVLIFILNPLLRKLMHNVK
ncbi:MAG: peptide MFS transporter [Saprospiraceae bacterium]|nr:peptide MFS transporter [Saprospiraceae bacterium]